MSTYRRVVVWALSGVVSIAPAVTVCLPASAQTVDGRTYDNAASDLGTLDGDDDLDPAEAADDLAASKVRKPEHPQDPNDRLHADSFARRLDAKDHAGLYAPLDEPPYAFRNGKAVLPDDDWRTRDDAAFEALGLRRASLIFHPEVGTHLLATDNLFAAPSDRQSDYAAVITPSLKVTSDWNRHEMELFFSGEHRFWNEHQGENTGKFEARGRSRIDITSRTSVETGARYSRDVDGRGSSELPESAKQPGVKHVNEVYLQGNQRFNRLGFRLRGSVERDLYEDIELNNGSTLDNGDRSNDNSKVEWRTSYEFSPRLEVFTDWENNWRRFHRARDRNGFAKDRHGWLAASGAKVEVLPTVNVTGRVGYALSKPDDAAFGDIEGLVADASIVWQPQSFITVTLGTKTEINESTEAGVNGSFDRIWSFELKTDWTYRFSSAFVATRTVKDVVDGPVDEVNSTYTLRSDYAFSRNWRLDASYTHTHNEAATSFRENEVRVGLKWRH